MTKTTEPSTEVRKPTYKEKTKQKKIRGFKGIYKNINVTVSIKYLLN